MTHRPFAGRRGGALAGLVATLLVAAAVTGGAAGVPAAGGGGADPHGTPGTATDGDASTGTPAGAVLVVDGDDDGDDEYATIGAALDDAAAGDTVEVRPGTYRETVTVATDVTLVAPRGATLDGSTLDEDAVGITVPAGSGAAPTVAGLTVTGYDIGINASGTGEDWTLRNVTLRDNRRRGPEPGVGVDASGTWGDWTVHNSTFRNNDDAVETAESAGGWTVRNSTFRDNDYGVDASYSSGDWAVHDSTFQGNRDGVETWYAGGDWVVADSTFRANREGVYTTHSTGDWTVRNSTFRGNTYNGVDAGSTAGDWAIYGSVFRNNTMALDAIGASGDWEVHRTTFVGSEKSAIYAVGAPARGDATRNWWGNVSGQDVDDCYGNVDCTDHLTEPPVDQPVFVERSDTDRWNATATVTLVKTDPPTDTARPVGPSDGEVLATSVVVFGIPVAFFLGVVYLLRREGHL